MPFAARVSDVAGHGGVIVIGSSKVLIGGMMAARVGDMLTCPATDPKAHVSGNILMGSTSVMIDGAFAARQGDPTSCGINGVSGVGMPASGVPGEFGDQGSLIGDGDVGLLWGKYDGHWNPGGGQVRLNGSLAHAEGETAVGDGVAGGSVDLQTVELEGHYGLGALGFGVRSSGLAEELHTEASDGSGLSETGGLANVAAYWELLCGTDGRRIGFATGGGLQASGVEGSVANKSVYSVPFLGGYSLAIETIGGASAESLGAAGHTGAYYDLEDSRFHLTQFLDAGLAFGVAGGYDISVGSTPGVGMPGVPGVIVTGCPTVIIGG